MRPSQTTAPPLPMIVTAHPRAWMGTLQQTGQRAAVAPSILSLSLLVLVFVIALLLAVGASAWFTRRLETISDLFDLSAGLLSLLGALGANIPNYVASLAAAASGQFMVGLGIILGSNIYNIAIILGISTFASKAQHGIALTGTAAKEVRVVATSTLAIMLTTLLVDATVAGRGRCSFAVAGRRRSMLPASTCDKNNYHRVRPVQGPRQDATLRIADLPQEKLNGR